MTHFSKWVERFHNRIGSNSSKCNELDDNACQAQNGNYLLFVVSLVLSKIADSLASAKVVLPWLMATTGAPIFLTSLLVPIRESGAMLPQIVLGAHIRRQATRKQYLVYGAVLQAIAVLALLFAAISLSGTVAGIAIVVLTILFSLARAISSIANKDVMGKTIDKSKRGKLSGTAASIAGAITIVFGGALYLRSSEQGGAIILLALAAVCFLLSAFSCALIKEYDGDKSDDKSALEVAKNNLKLLKQDIGFARFVWVRSLMISSGLAAPYLVLMAEQQASSSYVSLASLIVLGGIASLISGRIWGKLADKNSKGLMAFTASLNTIICLLSALFICFEVDSIYPYLALFFVLLVVHEGVRQARKTYLVDMAGGNKRTDYVSVSNSLIGVVLLLIGLLSGALAQFSIFAVMLAFALFSGIAFALSFSLKNVSKKD
ncbi:Major Facilitator Superfamily protein [Pseudoalteromonas sp. P1-9]|uniref:MFS transporter n=1 Tax=Pseudoalteromonas sp. P1-9 TaxID=1710354 RepID=UPI0006D63685|nr:MFS transporter [Pseudoalteromonas sp. P1-9]KPV98403.1 Major Facilitator Superfamily protein [Pseudoalteromonas sp. P1-9]